MNSAKKALSSVVVSTTILWSMGASMLVNTLTAHAAVEDGTLIKAKEVGAVYYYKGGKRWTFPNEKTYKTWFKDFSSVKTIPLSELQTYQLSGNATYRAGTRLVKITTDPKVYAVEPSGKLRWVKDEVTAKALYGNDWAKKVDDVPDAFFTNYTIGSDVSSAVYPDGALLKSGSNYFYIEAGKKRAVDAAALASNKFNVAFAVSVADVSAYADGSALGAAEVVDLAKSAPASTTPGTTPAPGTTPSASTGSLTVAAASDTPTAGSIVADATTELGGQKLAKMLKLSLTATGGDVKVTQLQAKRLGVSKDGDVDYLYLADANNTVLAKQTSISTGVATFSGNLLTVKSGTTATLWVLEDVNRSAAAGSTQGWSVDSAGMKIEGTGTVTGSASSNLQTVAVVADLAQLEFATSTPLTATNVDAGKTGFTLGTFKFRALDQDIIMNKLKFSQIGSIANTDLANLKIQVGGVQFDGVKSLDGSNTLTVDLSKDKDGKAVADAGLKILAGQTKFVDIVGDIVAGTNRTFKFSIQNSEDVVAFDNNYKVYVGAYEWNTDAFSVQTLGESTIQTGTLTTSLASDTPFGNVASASTGAVLAKFTFTAAGEDMKVTSLGVNGASADGTTVLKNVKLMLDGVQVGTTVASSTAILSTAVAADKTTVAASFTFTNNFIVRTAKPSVLTVVADLTDSTLGAGDTLTITLRAGSSNAQGMVSLASKSTTSLSGNTLTVQGGAPTVLKNTAVNEGSTTDATGVINDRDVKIGSFILQAGAGEGSKITSIALQDNIGGGLNAYFNNLRLMNGTKKLATEVGSLSAASSTYTFTLTEAITLTKGQQYVVDVVADVLSTTSNASINGTAVPAVFVKASGVNYQTTETGQSGTAPAALLNLQNVFVASVGSMTAAAAADTPIAQQLVMGQVNVPLFKFKLTAGKSEDVNITDLAVSVTMSTTATVTNPTGILKNIRLLEGDAAIGSPIISLTYADASATAIGAVTGATNTAYAKFSSLAISVLKNTAKTYTIVGDISSSPDIYSGVAFTFYLLNGYDQSASAAMTVRGAKSGTTITASGVAATAASQSNYNSTAVRGYAQQVYKAKISVAHAANAPVGASSKGTGQVVAKFVVSNAANVNNTAANITAMGLAISTSISQPAAGTARAVTIYKTETVNAANQLITSSIRTDSTVVTGLACEFGSSRNEAACPVFVTSSHTFATTTIEAGSSLVYTVTVDTNDASANNTLTVGIPTGGIIWNDGNGTSGSYIITSVDTLPLTGKTLTY